MIPITWLALQAPASTPAPSPGIPFGLFGMAGRELIDPYTSSMQEAQPETILQDLASAKSRGARIVVNFGGGGRKFTDGGGRFDYNLWKARIDRFRPMAGQINAYVADGTLLATMVLDEPFAVKRWGGEKVPMPMLDQMAGYLKSVFPDVVTTVRAAPSELQHFQWHYLDASWAQYTARKGPIDQFVSTEAAAAKSDGLGFIVGLNITKGGDGSSGNGSREESSMSGAEILRDGHALLGAPSACAFISWDSRARVIDRPDVASALKELAAAAGAHPVASCRAAGGRGTR